MLSGIYVTSVGDMNTVSISNKRKKLKLGNDELHMHYTGDGFMILSKHDKAYILKKDAKLFQFSLPPPLNKYIYPEDIIILKSDDGTAKSLKQEDLCLYCDRIKADLIKIKNAFAVYDVPISEPVAEEEEFSEQEEVEYEESEGEEREEQEEEWEEDEDSRMIPQQ
jgi:hypothetical protein